MSEQLMLLADVQIDEHAWKTTTGTSREAVRVLEASGHAEILRFRILKAIRHLWNRSQQSPTADEIATYLYQKRIERKRVIPDPHPDHVKPRLCELERGRTVRRIDPETKQKYSVQVGGGLIEKAGKRVSVRSGMEVHTWRCTERGTARALDNRWRE